MRILVLTAVLALAGNMAAAQTAPAEPKNYSIDPWHLNVPKPVSNPVTGVTEKIPGSGLSAETAARSNATMRLRLSEVGRPEGRPLRPHN
jgi:hypothetical protein